jgi:hypothetical protein
MSREYESEYEGDGPPPELWQRGLEHHLRSRVGKRMLRELEEALLELPEKRLIRGALCRQGEVCAVGAYIVHKAVARGRDRTSILEELDKRAQQFASYLDEEGDYEAAEDTVVAGKLLAGLSKYLGWTVSQHQDSIDDTEERRYELVLAWVRKLIEQSESPLPEWAMGKKDRLAAASAGTLL